MKKKMKKTGTVKLFPFSFTIGWIGINLFRYGIKWNFVNIWNYEIEVEIICLRFGFYIDKKFKYFKF